MCFSKHTPNPEPTRQPMPVVGSVTGQSLNVTEGGLVCPNSATACSNYSTPLACYHGGICCDLNGQMFCGCPPEWKPPDCHEEIVVDPFESLFSEKSTSVQAAIIAVIVIVILAFVVLAAYAIKRYRKRQQDRGRSSNSRNSGHEQSPKQSKETHRLQDTNGNSKSES